MPIRISETSREKKIAIYKILYILKAQVLRRKKSVQFTRKIYKGSTRAYQMFHFCSRNNELLLYLSRLNSSDLLKTPTSRWMGFIQIIIPGCFFSFKKKMNKIFFHPRYQIHPRLHLIILGLLDCSLKTTPLLKDICKVKTDF